MIINEYGYNVEIKRMKNEEKNRLEEEKKKTTMKNIVIGKYRIG